MIGMKKNLMDTEEADQAKEAASKSNRSFRAFLPFFPQSINKSPEAGGRRGREFFGRAKAGGGCARAKGVFACGGVRVECRCSCARTRINISSEPVQLPTPPPQIQRLCLGSIDELLFFLFHLYISFFSNDFFC